MAECPVVPAKTGAGRTFNLALTVLLRTSDKLFSSINAQEDEMKNQLASTVRKFFTQPLFAVAFSLLLATPSVVSAQKLISPKAASNSGVQAQPPYSVSVFAQSVPGVYTQPDSIAPASNAVFIGYGNGGAPNGSTAKPSTIVQYDFNGNVHNQVFVNGHNDGLKINPTTGDLWALQNEDANATLVIFDPQTLTQKQKYFLGTGPHGGGYDDMVFLGGNIY